MQSLQDRATFNFDDADDFVANYDKGPPLFVPGYHASHMMAAAVLGQRLGDRADLLIVGAGGGVEMAAFAQAFPGWTMVGVDPSQAMLALARQRLEHAGLMAACRLETGIATSAPEGPFDGATAFLCLQFAPDDGNRLAQLQAIRARLKPGAPFLMVHNAGTGNDLDRDFARFALHARLGGAPEDMIEKAIAMNRDTVSILPEAREEELLHMAGFRLDGKFYKGLWINGWEATAV